MKLEQNKIRRIIEIAAIILISGIFFFACSSRTKEKDEIVEIETADLPSEDVMAEQDEPKTVFVYVCGAVAAPGVYELPADARKADALSAAGGFTEDAATDAVNLAAHIEDADMVRIPYLGEAYSEDAGTEGDSKININTAGVNELTTLPGIGKSKAEAIIEYREKAGKYARTEDLMKVPGIKEGTFDGIRDLIRTE